MLQLLALCGNADLIIFGVGIADPRPEVLLRRMCNDIRVNKNMYLCIVIIKNNNYMKNVFKIVITYMIALLLVNCYVTDDYTVNSNFSLLSYSQTTVAQVNDTSNINRENNEKLICKILTGGQLQLTHKNVIFDEGTNIKFDSQLIGNKIIISETGDFGKSGKYAYYILVAKVGVIKDGDYIIVVKRNDHIRQEFKFHYDSSKAK